MARCCTYHLHSIQTTALPGAALIQAVQPGRIVGVQIMVAFTGGAGAGYYNISVDMNNQAQNFQNINNPPRELILASLLFVTSTSQVAGIMSPYIPLSDPLRVGDLLCLNINLTGTAATALTTNANVWIMEAGG